MDSEICNATIEVLNILDKDADLLTAFKALLSESQLALLRGIIELLKARTDYTKDDATALKVGEFIGSFDSEQSEKLAGVVTPTLGSLFLQLHGKLTELAKRAESASSGKSSASTVEAK